MLLTHIHRQRVLHNTRSMSSEKILVAQELNPSQSPGSIPIGYSAEEENSRVNMVDRDENELELGTSEHEELGSEDESNVHSDPDIEHEVIEVSNESPQKSNVFLGRTSGAEDHNAVVELRESNTNNEILSHDQYVEVIDLDSEEEIENLEEEEGNEQVGKMDNENDEHDYENEIEEMENMDEAEEGGPGKEYEEEEVYEQVDTNSSGNEDEEKREHIYEEHKEDNELSDSEVEDLDLQNEEMNLQTDSNMIREHATSKSLSNFSEFPIFINIRGDEFLLVPFFDDCNYDLEDTISLFTLDEVVNCTLSEFFKLLRGNGDLIDAYDFNKEDELCLRIPELSLLVTEDNVHTGDLKLKDLMDTYFSLISRDKKDDKDTPDKMTILVSMQPRFITNYKRILDAAISGKRYCDLFDPVGVSEESNGNPKKRKRLLL